MLLCRRINCVQLSLFFFFVSFYFFTNAGWYLPGDELTMLKVAKKIVSTSHPGFRLEETASEAEDDLVKGRNGLYYYKYGLGQSLVESPFLLLHQTLFGWNKPDLDFSMSELLFVLLCPSLVSAVGCILIFNLSNLLGFLRKTSLGLALVYGLGTMAWPYSKSLLSETTLNVAVLGGVYAAISYCETTSRRWLALSGMFLGFSFITKNVSALVIPLVITYLLARVPTRRTLGDLIGWFGIPLLLFVGFQGYYNDIRYDSALEFGYSFGWDHLGFSTPLSVGLWGLLLSPGKSFFLYSPVALLGLFSFPRFLDGRRKEGFLFLGIVLVFLLLHARWWAWSGDRAWGPRFLLPITPYFVLFLGGLMGTWRKRSAFYQRICLLVMGASLFVQLLGVAVDPQLFPKHRMQWVGNLVKTEGDFPLSLFLDLSYVHFNPELSHILGNYWLLKHMLFPYDLWSDPPWKMVGNFGLAKSMPAQDEKIVPFWWPASFPLISWPSRKWVFPLAAFSLLMAVFWGLMIWKANREERGSCP
jgi:hypothetical protein